MKNINKAHEILISILQDYNEVSYDELEQLTGMSRSGLRSRISELARLGYNISKKRNGMETIISLGESNELNLPVTDTQKLITRTKNFNQFNDIIEFINEIKTVKKGYKLKNIEDAKKPAKDNEALLVLSDFHIGQKTTYEPYNLEIAKRRLEFLTYRALTTLAERNIKTINIAMLGDIIEGDMIFRNQTFQIEMSALEQVRASTELLANMFNSFLTNGLNVRVTGVRGNHGITNYRNLEEDNWDNVVYAMLDLIFNKREGIDFYYVNKSETEFCVCNKKILLMHGDMFPEQIKTASGLKDFRGKYSFYGLQKGDIILAGHYHSFGLEMDQDRMLLRNGAVSSVSEFARKFNLLTTPEQTLLILNPNVQFSPYPEIIPIELP